MKLLFISLKESLKKYYFEQFYFDIKNFSRSPLLGGLLITARSIIYILLICNKLISDKLTSLDTNFKDIPNINLQEMGNSEIWIVYLSSALLGLMMILFLMSWFATSINANIPNCRHLLSFLSMAFNYIFFVPLLSLNLSLISTHSLAVLNGIFSIILSNILNLISIIIKKYFAGFLIGSHDQDHTICPIDALSKRSPLFWDFILIFLEIVNSILSSLIQSEIPILLGSIILGGFKVFHNLFYLFWNNCNIKTLDLFLSILHSLITITIILSFMRDKKYAISILLLLLIPLSAQIANKIQTSLEDIYHMPFIQEGFNSQKFGNPYFLDQQLRMLWNYLPSKIEDFKKSKISVAFETVLENHKMSCGKQDECSICYSLNSQVIGDLREAYIDGRHRLNSVKAFIIEQYQFFVGTDHQQQLFKIKDTNEVNSSIYFSYISFLAEIEESKILSFIELIKIKKKLHLSIRELMFLEQINKKVKKIFEEYKIGQTKLPENKIQVYSKGQETIDPEMHNYLLGIQFEEDLSKAQQAFIIAFKMKEKLLTSLCEDVIDLLQVKKQSIDIMMQRDKVKNLLQLLGAINYENSRLQFFMDIYVSHLGFFEKKEKLFRKNFNKENMEQNIKLDLSIFSKDSCVVFITLIDDLGVIKKIQTKFESLFGFKTKEILGKKINTIMPNIIGKYHSKFLAKFIHKSNRTSRENQFDKFASGSNSLCILKPNQKTPSFHPLILAQNNKGWAIPISLKFKVDNLSLDDCGLTGHIQVINKEYQYVMTDGKQFQVQLLSQQLFDKVLCKYVDQQDIQKIYLNRIIPILPYFEKQIIASNNNHLDSSSDLMKTIAFLPKSEGSSAFSNFILSTLKKTRGSTLFQKMEIEKMYKAMKKYSIEFFDLFQIKIKFYCYSNEFTSFNIVEIQQMWKITTPNSQREALLLLKSQLKSYLSVEFDPSDDIKILQKLEEISQFQMYASRTNGIKSNMGYELDDDQEEGNEYERFDSANESYSHSRIEGKGEKVKAPQTDFNDQNSTQKLKKNKSQVQFQNESIQQYEEIGQFFTTSHDADLSRQVEISNRQINSLGIDLNNSFQLIQEPASNKQDIKFQSKTISTIYIGGEVVNNQSTFFDTMRGENLDGKESMQEVQTNKNEEKLNKHRSTSYKNEQSANKFEISPAKKEYQDHRFYDSEEKLNLQPEQRNFGQKANENHLTRDKDGLSESFPKQALPHSQKKIDSSLSLISNQLKPDANEPNFISFAVVPLHSNQQVITENPHSQFSLISNINNNDQLSPQRQQFIPSFVSTIKNTNNSNANVQNRHHHQHQKRTSPLLNHSKHYNSMLQIVSHSSQYVPLEKHSQSQISIVPHIPPTQKQFNPNNNNQNQQSSQIFYQVPSHSQNPSSMFSSTHHVNSNQIIQNNQSQSTIQYQEKPKGLFELLKDKLNQLKKQKKQKQPVASIMTIQGEDHLSEMQSQINTLGKRVSSNKQLNTSPSALNNTPTKDNSVYLQSFLRSYYDIPQGSTNIVGKKRKNEISNWGINEDSAISLKKQSFHEGDSFRKRQAELSSYESSSLKEDGEDHKTDNHKLQRMLTTSVKTSQATSQEHKSNIRKLISSNRGDNSLIQLRLFGFMGILTVIILTIYQFVSTNSLFQESKIHISHIPWSNNIRASFSYPYVYMKLQNILFNNGFKDPSLYSSEFGNELVKRSESQFQLIFSLIKNLQNQGTEGNNYFNFVVTSYSTFVFSTDYASIPDSAIQVKDPNYKTNLYINLLQFSYMIISFNLQALQTKYNDPQLLKFILDNFPTFITNMTSVQTIVQDQSQQILDQILDLVKNLLALVISVSFVLIFMIFPLYFFVQNKNEKVLKLLSTIAPAALHIMIKNLMIGMRVFTSESTQEISNTRQVKLKLKNDSYRKKKNISSTTTVTKFKIIHLLVGIFIFSLVIIQPVVSLILTRQFLNQAEFNINLLGQLYNMIAHSASNMVVSYNYIEYKLLQTTNYFPEYFIIRARKLVPQNSIVLEDLSQTIKTSSSQSYRQQHLYDEFLYKMLNTNICDALEQFPEYTSTQQFDLTPCNSLSSGIMQQGFQISMKRYFQTFYDLLEIFNLEESQIVPNLLVWQKELNIRDFDLFAEFLRQSTIAQKDFLIEIMSQDIEYIITITIVLLAFQIFLLGIVLSYAWIKIYQFILKDMQIIRRILTLLDIDILIDNPYIISYLTK